MESQHAKAGHRKTKLVKLKKKQNVFTINYIFKNKLIFKQIKKVLFYFIEIPA